MVRLFGFNSQYSQRHSDILTNNNELNFNMDIVLDIH